ncbi:MAG: fucokinase, partial [bacterium]|nr:fucokinase [bacterium]
RDECFAVMSRIKELADEMTEAVETDDVDRFAELLNEHWICSKILDEGTSNANIESIYDAIKDYAKGFFISGAGGGGLFKKGIRKIL